MPANVESKKRAVAALAQKKYFNICRKITRGNSLWNDLYQESILAILELPEKKFAEIKCLECFFIKIADRNWNSSTSPFYYKYRKIKTEQLTANVERGEEEGEEEKKEYEISRINKIISDSHWYDRELFNLFLKLGSRRKVALKTGIPETSVKRTIREMKKKIKNSL